MNYCDVSFSGFSTSSWRRTAFGSNGDTNASPQVRELSLSRGMISRDGSVRFRIDLTKALEGSDDGQADNNLQVVKLRFTYK